MFDAATSEVLGTWSDETDARDVVVAEEDRSLLYWPVDRWHVDYFQSRFGLCPLCGSGGRTVGQHPSHYPTCAFITDPESIPLGVPNPDIR